MIKTISLFGMTNVGQVRSHNEDDFVICKDLAAGDWSYKRGEVLPLSDQGAVLVVADGMGGTNAGEVASQLAQQAVKDFFTEAETLPTGIEQREYFLQKCILSAHQTIVNHQHEHLDTAGMGTTLVIAWVIDDMVHVGWSGDSRCYILHDGDVHESFPFTNDHSMVWELVKKGQLTAEEAREHPQSNIIMQSLGDEKSPPDPSTRSARLYKGSRVLVCSDGLNGMISDNVIREVLDSDNPDISEICKVLVNLANEAGGTDNITCLMLQVEDGEIPKPRVIKEVVQELSESSPSASQTGAEASIKTLGKSNTAALRTKVSVRNYLIAGLVLLVLVLGGAIVTGVFTPDRPTPPDNTDSATTAPSQNDSLDGSAPLHETTNPGTSDTESAERPTVEDLPGGSGVISGPGIGQSPATSGAQTGTPTPMGNTGSGEVTTTPPADSTTPVDSTPPDSTPPVDAPIVVDSTTTPVPVAITPPVDTTVIATPPPPPSNSPIRLTPIRPDTTASTTPPSQSEN